MINFDDYTNENKIEHIPDHLYKTLIIGCSGSGKTKCYLIKKIINQILIKYICMQKIL